MVGDPVGVVVVVWAVGTVVGVAMGDCDGAILASTVGTPVG